MAGSKDPHEEPRVEQPEPDHSPAGHEERDINIRKVSASVAGLVVLCVVALGAAFAVFFYFQRGQPPEAGGIQAKLQPPSPRLQENPVLDLKQMRGSEDQILETYGWVDRQKGIVRLPIGRAIDLLAQRGLPARQQAGPETSAPDVSVPTESGLGPKMIQPGGPLAAEPGK